MNLPPGMPAENQLVTATVAGGGVATYRVTNIEQHETGIWTYDLEPVDDKSGGN